MNDFDAKHAAAHGYTRENWDEVGDNPEWEEEDFKNARPFAEALPELAASARRMRGPQKSPTKKLVSLRLSPDVLDRFKAGGRGWQSRIDEVLRKAVGL